MQLKYLSGKEINLYMGEYGKAYRFTPIGELPDNFAEHILKTRPKDFEIYVPKVEIKEELHEEVVEHKFKCEQCAYEATTNAGLSAHTRYKHKEKQ